MITAIIPARGGSKGIPRKNLVNVCGKPLLCWSIEQAKASEHVNSVIVATDCDEIEDAAVKAGADVFRRSALSATDTAASEVVLAEVIVKRRLEKCEAIVFLQATSPCRREREIDLAIEMFRRHASDSVFGCRHVEGYVWRKSLHGDCVPCLKEPRLPRQKQVTRTLEENGSLYVFRPEVFLREGSRHCGKIVPHIMHPMDSYQIDEPEDVELLERCMEVRLDCRASTTS